MDSIFTRQQVIRGRYAINTFDSNGKQLMMIESLITGQCDYPIVWPNGQLAYDWPEIWPKYFRIAVEKFAASRII
ncbi:hypothetical protein LCGC14_1745780 [marine sediment metagenome]|uniref:Uncharacterized protein n=1 Tax=marine sediment metagenome TaxID=412755 RepID=A0A0F9H5F6_9ZZZZ